VVAGGGLLPVRRELPIDWVAEISEAAVVLEASRETVEAVAPLDADD